MVENQSKIDYVENWETGLKALFSTFHHGKERSDSWNEIITEHREQKAWILQMQQRSRELRQNYDANCKLLSSFLFPILYGTKRLPPEGMNRLFEWTQDMYYENYDDPFTLQLLTDFLIPYYEKKQDRERLIFCYLCAGYANQEISRTKDHVSGLRSVRFYENILQMKEQMAEFENPQNRTAVFIAYSNLIRTSCTLGNLSIKKVYRLWKDATAFYSKPENHIFDETQPRIPELFQFFDEDFKIYSFNTYCETSYRKNRQPGSSYDPVFGKKLYDICRSYMESCFADPSFSPQEAPDLFCNYQDLLATSGEITWEEAWRRIDHFCQELPPLDNEDETAEDAEDCVSIYMNPLNRKIEALNASDLPMEQKSALCLTYCNEVVDFARKNNISSYSYAINNALEQCCFTSGILNCLVSVKDKERLIFHLVVTRHMVTFMHSTMVQKISLLILDAVFAHCPEYLVGVFHTKSVSQIRKLQEEIRNYVSQSALLHDVGKNSLIDLINTEYRRISDAEFEAIKRHPQIGADYLASDKSFRIYRDIALGHHKFYNGEGGYPEHFDNRRSSWKPLIDLITISDCLDAATDWLGRNYQRAKGLSQVLEEFQQSAGVRYHPGYVSLLCTDTELYRKLEHLIGEERQDIYYDVHTEYFS